MNFDQFATSFKNPEPVSEEIKPETTEPADIVIAGSVLSITDKSCCIHINGAQYEVASGDIIDIQVLVPPKAPETPAATEAAPAEEEGGKPKGKRVEKKDVDKGEGGSVYTGPQTVLIRINKNAIFWQRTPVPAAVLAVMGTWMQVVPAEAA